MRQQKSIAVIVFLVGLTTNSIVWAHGSARYAYPHHGQFQNHAQVEHITGAPLIAPWHYRSQIPYYVYSYPPTMALPAMPLAYRQQGSNDQESIDQENDPVIIQQPSTVRYYCNNPQGFYPHVRICPKGWQTMRAQSPGS